MKFSAREDVEATRDRVFDAICEFDMFERQAMRRGADVKRVKSMSPPDAGMTWDVSFKLRGRMRDLHLEIVDFDRPNLVGVEATSASIDGMFTVELLALSRTRTRMTVGLELKPKNLAARLMVQSLKLAKANLTKRFKLRVAEFAKTLEDRLQRSA